MSPGLVGKDCRNCLSISQPPRRSFLLPESVPEGAEIPVALAGSLRERVQEERVRLAQAARSPVRVARSGLPVSGCVPGNRRVADGPGRPGEPRLAS